jgi:signal transduction histidine kinase
VTSPWRPPRPSASDIVLLVLIVVLQTAAPRTGSETQGSEPEWVGVAALVTAVGQAGALLWRRVAPLRSSAAVMILYAASVLAVGAVPPLAPWVAIWALATRLPGWSNAIRGAGVAAGATIALLLVSELVRAGTGAALLLSGITVVVCLSAVLVRSERGRVDAVRLATVSEERLRIARDMHDVVGHGLSVVAVQSSTARLALAAGDAPAALTALTAVESSSRSAMREMRQLLSVLTANGSEVTTESTDAPSPGLAALPALIDNVKAGGVAITLETSIDPETVSPSVQLCAYRIAQEALTNALKHSPGAVVAVTLLSDVATDGRPGLRLRVQTTDGPGSPRVDSSAGSGVGVSGIQARAASVGGSAHVAATETGWLVDARLPLSVGVRR